MLRYQPGIRFHRNSAHRIEKRLAVYGDIHLIQQRIGLLWVRGTVARH